MMIVFGRLRLSQLRNPRIKGDIPLFFAGKTLAVADGPLEDFSLPFDEGAAEDELTRFVTITLFANVGAKASLSGAAAPDGL